MFCQFCKRQAPTSDEGPSNKIVKILDMRSIVFIFITQHRMTFLNLGTLIVLGSIEQVLQSMFEKWKPGGDTKKYLGSKTIGFSERFE